jgi:DNA-directed RNA polymerase subunit RPC12/RpoP
MPEKNIITCMECGREVDYSAVEEAFTYETEYNRYVVKLCPHCGKILKDGTETWKLKRGLKA